MSSFIFPTLDSLQDELPSARAAATEWVGLLGSTAPKAAAPSNGWTPPGLEQVSPRDPGIDLEAERVAAQEMGFRAGYAQGQAAGTAFGLAEGRLAGREEGKAEVLMAEVASLHDFTQGLQAVVSGVTPAVDRWREDLEARVTDLAMNAVRALLAAELQTSRPDALGIVREALGHAEGAIKATVRLSPFDRASLAERKDQVLAACAGLREVELVDDSSITGGCIIETEQGLVDATLATRLQLLEAA